jgi:hypothetical protein
MTDDCKLLSDTDKEIYKEAVKQGDVDYIRHMSIFSTLGKYEKHGDYNIFITDPNVNIYYIGYYVVGGLNVFIDQNKKLLFYSKFFFGLFDCFLSNIDIVLTNIQNTNINENIVDIGSNIVSIENWFLTYGHYKDEIFVLTDYVNNINNKYKVLIDYHTNNDITDYPVNINYQIIEKLLLKGNSINAYTLKKKVLKLTNLILIRHHITDTTFHSFPLNVRNEIFKSIENKNITFNKVFLTRDKATHLPRNLNNQAEIEDYLSNNNITIINPELITYEQLINSIKNLNVIIITWGGALVNLIYLKPHTRVYILKSKSYEHESIELFDKIIKTYQLQVKIIVHQNNEININKLSDILK